jgi:hypothetical protein
MEKKQCIWIFVRRDNGAVLLQVRRVKVHRGTWGRRRLTGEVVPAREAGGEGLGQAVDCRRHPRTWSLQAIAALLDEVVNTSASSSPGARPPCTTFTLALSAIGVGRLESPL